VLAVKRFKGIVRGLCLGALEKLCKLVLCAVHPLDKLDDIVHQVGELLCDNMPVLFAAVMLQSRQDLL